MARRCSEDVAISARKALELLESGMSILEVANELGVSTRTVQRWQTRPRIEIPIRSQVEVVSDSEGDFPGTRETLILSAHCANRLETLIPLALGELERILLSPDSRTGDKLKVCQIIGSWSSLDGGLDGALRRLNAAGFIVIDPSIRDQVQESKAPRGLTEEGAELIKRKILFGEDFPED